MKSAWLLLVVGALVGRAEAARNPALYLGQSPPGMIPLVFAPGIVSNGNIHSRLEITPDGQELFWNTVDLETFTTQILSARVVDSKLSDPKPPSFAGPGSTQAAVLSLDGKRLFFKVKVGEGWGTRFVERTENGWSAPQECRLPWNASPSFTKTGRVYFSSEMKTKVWNTGIFWSAFPAGADAGAKALDEAVNIPNAIDYTPYVAPDETFLLFSSNRPLIGDTEDMHVFVSFHQGGDAWSAPRKISSIEGRFPSLSPDQKYLFFCGDDGNIYWVDTDIIEPLRPAAPGPPSR